MNAEQFHQRMDELVSCCEKKDHERSLSLASTLREDLLAAPTDPLQLGWARYYIFKNLYHLDRFQDALDFFLAKEKAVWLMSTNNVAWMHSVAAQCASEANRPIDVLKLRRAWAYRMRQDDPQQPIFAARNLLLFLENLGEQRRNFGPAVFLTSFAVNHNIPALLVEGLEALADNFRQSRSPAIADFIRRRIATFPEPETLNEEDRTELNNLCTKLKALLDGSAEEHANTGAADAGESGGLLGSLAAQRLPNGLNSLLGTAKTWFGSKIASLKEAATNAAPQKLSEIDQALFQVIRAGDPKRIAWLLEQGANIHALENPEEANTTLMIAIRFAPPEAAPQVVQLLIEAGADLHAREAVQNTTALLFAVNMGKLDLVQLLLHAGADTEQKGIFGQTPLIRAVIEEYPDILQLLLDWGAYTEWRDEAGFTALMIAARGEDPHLMSILLDAGADSQVCTEGGHNLLHLAAMDGKIENVRFLKARKVCDLSAKDHAGMTPLNWAVQEGHDEVVKEF